MGWPKNAPSIRTNIAASEPRRTARAKCENSPYPRRRARIQPYLQNYHGFFTLLARSKNKYVDANPSGCVMRILMHRRGSIRKRPLRIFTARPSQPVVSGPGSEKGGYPWPAMPVIPPANLNDISVASIRLPDRRCGALDYGFC